MISFQTNIDSLIAQQNLNINSTFQSKTIQQLTSGYRINQSGDDAAGLSVANQDRDQIAQITQGVANGNNGTAQLQIMDGGMSNISQILDRLQTLATQSASSSFTGSRSDLNAEFQTDIGELNRQAQAIGLNTGGTYAQMMDVYLGGGGGATASSISNNGQVTVDLSKSTVDAHSLGLSGMGMQVVAGTADISSNSTTHSAYDIVTNANNMAHEATPNSGSTTFYLSGPGFSGNSKVALAVNLAGVSDINTLVTAINNAVTTAAAGTTTAAQSLKAAGIMASVNTDSTGGQELSFSSSTAAFQVEAGDQMANALMGNLSTNAATPAEGVPITSTVTGVNTASGGTSFSPSGVTVQISGAGLSSPVSIAFAGGISTVTGAIGSLQSQVANNTALQAAGITVTQATAGSPLIFTSATGETFSVQATGDTGNLLGLGALDTSSAANSPAFYSTITAANYSATSNGNGLATLGFSINGGPTDGGVTTQNPVESAATITGTAPTGINSSAQVNTSSLGTLTLNVNNTPININFANDANKGATETLANVAAYINNQVNAAMGWGSNVHLATVSGTGTGATINLVDPYADSNSSISVSSGTAATALGLSGSATGTDAVGNTVTVNLAAGDATGASYTGAASATMDTSGGGTVNFTVDGQSLGAAFSSDLNNAGTAAVFTGGTLGASGASTVDTGALQAQAAQLGGTALGNPASVGINTAALEAQQAVYVGPGLASATGLTLTGDTALTINGTAIDISAAADLSTVAGDITSSAAGVTATVVTNNGLQALQLKSNTGGTTISVTNNQSAQDAGLLLSGQSGGVVASGAAAQGLKVTLDNGSQKTITWSSADTNAGASESLQNVTAYINSVLDGSGGFNTPGVNYATYDSSGVITIGSQTKGASSAVSVVNNAAAQALGLATAQQTGPSTASGSAAKTLGISIDGKTTLQVDFSADTNVDSSTGLESLTNVASWINTKLAASGSYGANYAAAAQVVDGAIQISSYQTGAQGAASGTSGSVAVSTGQAAQTLALNSAGTTSTVYGQNESLANVVSFLNGAAQKALGTSTSAQIFTVNGNNIGIASQTKGAVSGISVGTGPAAILTGLGLTANSTLASGQSASLTSIVNTLSQAFLANPTLREAGLQASQSGNALEIASSNNTNFRIGEYNTSGATTLGFGSTGGPFSAALNSGLSKATLLDAGGTSAIGTGATANPYLSFAPLQFGSDAQAVTFTANNAAGVQQALTLTLRNDSGNEAGATSGATIDSTVAFMNQQLQSSNNATLKSIVAVKENVNGVEQINFLSSLSSFSVSVGSSVNGNGLNAGKAQTYASVSNGTPSSSAIDTLTGAQAAVTAVTAAVALLGTAQAAVGKGENQLNYAINLAQSQITNISAAESQIRDANVAQEAANLTKAQVLQQSTVAAMAQANQEPQAVLSLLKQ